MRKTSLELFFSRAATAKIAISDSLNLMESHLNYLPTFPVNFCPAPPEVLHMSVTRCEKLHWHHQKIVSNFILCRKVQRRSCSTAVNRVILQVNVACRCFCLMTAIYLSTCPVDELISIYYEQLTELWKIPVLYFCAIAIFHFRVFPKTHPTQQSSSLNYSQYSPSMAYE